MVRICAGLAALAEPMIVEAKLVAAGSGDVDAAVEQIRLIG